MEEPVSVSLGPGYQSQLGQSAPIIIVAQSGTWKIDP
jgi:hypothetical protein